MVYDEDTVINAEKNNYTILSQIIFNLIADCRLPNPFSLEDLIDLLFKPSLTPQRWLLYHVYASIYREKYKHEKEKLKEIDHLCSILDTTDKDHKNLVKQWDALIDLLENSVQIVAEQGDAYRFIFPGEEGWRLVQDEDVLDTRFSSGLRPFSILWWPEQTADLSTYYPSSVLETGYDIIFFRVIRMMLMGVSLTWKMPFEQVYLHGLVRAEDGQKMSKSKGNGVDPLELIEKYGADALRGALLLGNTPGNDQRFSMQKVDYLWRFINKLRNATRYVQGTIGQLLHEKRSYTEMYHYLTDHIDEFSEYDNWIISKLNTVISSTTKYYEKFMIGEALQEIITFLWHDFCDWYIEIVKGNHSDLTPTILMYVLGTSYKILHPACPFVTEYLRQHTGFDEQLIASTWPLAIEGGKKNYRFNLLMDMITQWRALKQEVTKNSSEEVTLLVQGNKDIQLLVEEHEVLVKKLLYVSSIQYCNEQDPTPEWFQTVLLLDIKLGVQGLAKKDRKSQLHELEKKVEEEEQFLQRMRVTIASTDFLDKAPPKVVEEKKQKMDEVRQRIGALQHEIQRIKMEHK